MQMKILNSLAVITLLAVAQGCASVGQRSLASESPDFNHRNDEYYRQQKVLMEAEDAKFRAQIQNESQAKLEDDASKLKSQGEIDCSKQALIGAIAQAWNMGFTGALGWVDKLDPRYKADPDFHRDLIEMHDSIWNFEPLKDSIHEPTLDNECLRDARKLTVIDGLLKQEMKN